MFKDLKNTPPHACARRGVVFYIVLAVVTVMSIFILFYVTFSRQLAYSSFYHVNRERLRGISEVILDSAFARVQSETRNPGSEITRNVVAQMRLSDRPPHSHFDITAPFFEDNKSSLLLGATLDYEVKARVFDKRTKTHDDHDYYSGEGLATLEIDLKAAFKNSAGNILAQLHRRRHYDIKVVALVSNFQNRESSYAMSFPLDYALLVRDGLREFDSAPQGRPLNQGNKIIIADQSAIVEQRRGQVYFGAADANSPSERIYLNTDENTEELLPSLPVTSIEVSQEECIRLIPQLRDEVYDYEGLRGFFDLSVYPANRASAPANEIEEMARLVLSVADDNTRVDPLAAGIDFAGPRDFNYLSSFVRGAVNQRFLYVVHFRVDASNVTFRAGGRTQSIPPEGAQRLEEVGRVTCFSPDIPYLSNAASEDAQKLKLIATRLVRLVEPSVNPQLRLISKLAEDYPYHSDQAMQKVEKSEIFSTAPTFYSRDSRPLSDITARGSEAFRPFRHYGLYSSRFFYAQELEDAGIYDKEEGVLNLRGIVSVEFEPVTLVPPAGRNYISVRGQGALIAPKGFTIQTGIRREDPRTDMMVMFTRDGSIRIATDEPVEASLLAFNDSNDGSIYPSQPFNVVGAVGVDRLFLNNYPSGASTITYDERLRAADNSDEIFSISMSPWIRFDDLNFSREGS